MPLSKGVIPCEDVVKKFLILPTAKIYRKWNNPLQELLEAQTLQACSLLVAIVGNPPSCDLDPCPVLGVQIY
jgi:hypothetical protein